MQTNELAKKVLARGGFDEGPLMLKSVSQTAQCNGGEVKHKRVYKGTYF